MKAKISTILVAVIVSVVTTVASLSYIPVAVFDFFVPQKSNLGSTITVIQGSDRLTDSRAVINTNFANLNADKLEQSSYFGTTTHPNITSLPSLATVGTIISGIWNGTTVSVPYGGTGSTTLSQYSVLLGSSTNAISMVDGFGTSGQFLTSNGAGLKPTWQSASVDTNLSYNFTGSYFGVKNFWASSTVANPIQLNGVSFNTPSTQGAASTTLTNDGSGNLRWQPFGYWIYSDTTNGTTFDSTASTTIFSFTVPAGSLGTNNSINVKIPVTNFALIDPSSLFFELNYGGSKQNCNITVAAISPSGVGEIEIDLLAAGSTSAQEVFMKARAEDNRTGNTTLETLTCYINGTYSVDSTVAQTFSLTARTSVNNSSAGISWTSVFANVIK